MRSFLPPLELCRSQLDEGDSFDFGFLKELYLLSTPSLHPEINCARRKLTPLAVFSLHQSPTRSLVKLKNSKSHGVSVSLLFSLSPLAQRGENGIEERTNHQNPETTLELFPMVFSKLSTLSRPPYTSRSRGEFFSASCSFILLSELKGNEGQ